MKKLLVLVLVLGMASLANAYIVSAMDLVDNGDGTYSISLTSGMSGTPGMDPQVGDGSGGYFVLLGVDASSGALASTLPVVMGLSNANEGDAGDSGQFDYGLGIFGEFTTASTGAWTAASGVYADSYTAAEGATSVVLYRALDDGMGSFEFVEEIIIPEPATIALLCLGGLLLRKK